MPTDVKGGVTKQPHEIEFERRKAKLEKVRALRSSASHDIGRVFSADPNKPKNPDLDHVWALNKPERIVKFKARGYYICNNPDIMTDFPVGDGTHVYADCILMEIDRELRELLKLDSEALAMERQNGAEVFEAFARSSGIKAYQIK